MAKALPKKLFVKIETDNDQNDYFVADDSKYGLAEMGEKIRIGTYQLIEIEDAEVVLKTQRKRA